MSQSLTNCVSEAFLPHPPASLGVAVSGGGDSMALLHLLHEFSKVHQIQLHAVTVDHRLRPEAADEAADVAQYCAKIGVTHQTLVWEDWDGQGNLQQAARTARYAQISQWAHGRDIDTVALGHTADDQAETLLMRLARRSGVDGLAGMQARVLRHGITWVRPLLSSRREALRRYLVEQQVHWFDDPSNDDLSYDRIKTRKALELLAPLGIDVSGLTEVAKQMGEARKALEWHSFLMARDITSVQDGAVIFDDRRLRILPDEIQRRLLHKAIRWISGSDHGPRRDALANILAALKDGLAATADGCHIRRIAGAVWVFRELNAVKTTTCAASEVWDGRWSLTPPSDQPVCADWRVRALDMDGIEQCPAWRTAGKPHAVLLSSPSVWCGTELVAAPLAGYAQNWHATLEQSGESFFAALLTH